MSDDVSGSQPGIRLMIALVDGQISIGGPLDDPLLCYGLLEAAKDAIRAHQQRKQQQRRVEPVTLMPKGLVP